MIGFSNQKGRDIRKPVPGCMGRMINLFDLSSGMSGTKLLTDKPHRDGLQITRDTNEVLKESDSAMSAIKEKPLQVVHLPKSLSTNYKANGTPMKALMAEELSKEREVVCKQPTVIAKLMGLDALPAQQSVHPIKRDPQDRSLYSSCNSKKSAPPYQQQRDGFLEKPVILPKHPPPRHHIQQNMECKDVFEIRPQQIPRKKSLEHAPRSRGNSDYSINDDKRMALVRQKFMEAKRLATTQNLLQSKEFQDALEVLSTNRDLFLKFLEEPDSMLSQHLRGQRGQDATANCKRITVLRPTKASANIMNQGQMKNDLIHETDRRIKTDFFHSSKAGLGKTESLSQPTRIVVLKPSPGKNHNARKETLFPTMTIGVQEAVPEDLVNDETRDARKAAKEITRQMRESLSSNRKDETLLSHILSNVTTEDEDSFSRSGKEHVVEEECACSSTSQVSPASQDSCRCSEGFGSPHSSSFRSRFPYLPESSVIREAKRRLSERWVLVTSSGVNHEPEEIQRSSSTLGEMLSIRETKKGDLRDKRFGVTTGGWDDCGSNRHMNLQRSKSVLWSCAGIDEKVDSNAEAVNLHSGNHIIDEAIDKTKYESLSFKGRVSNLFSRNSRASDTDKSLYSSYMDHISHGISSRLSGSSESIIKSDNVPLQCSAGGCPKEGPIYNYEELLRKNLYSTNDEPEPGTPASKKENLPLEKLMASEDANDNLEQPSPVSVLEAQFEDDAISTNSSLHIANVNQEHHCASPRSRTTELLSCSLSWDDDDVIEGTNHYRTVAIKKSAEEEEFLMFARSLLSSSGLDDDEISVAMAGWYSLESPLDPALLDVFLEPKDEVARSRVRRSNQRLMFDCLNDSILEMSRSRLLDSCSQWPVSHPITRHEKSVKEGALGMVESLLSTNPKPYNRLWGDDTSSMVVDLIIRKEVSGRGWEEMVKLEVIEMVMVEIQGQIVDDLVAEALCCFCC